MKIGIICELGKNSHNFTPKGPFFFYEFTSLYARYTTVAICFCIFTSDSHRYPKNLYQVQDICEKTKKKGVNLGENYCELIGSKPAIA